MTAKITLHRGDITTDAVDAIVNHGMSAAEAVRALMDRGLKNELPQL